MNLMNRWQVASSPAHSYARLPNLYSRTSQIPTILRIACTVLPSNTPDAIGIYQVGQQRLLRQGDVFRTHGIWKHEW